MRSQCANEVEGAGSLVNKGLGKRWWQSKVSMGYFSVILLTRLTLPAVKGQIYFITKKRTMDVHKLLLIH